MNKRMPLRVNSISRAAAAWLAGLAFFLGAICSTPAFSQTETVVAQGRTDVCYESRDMAIRLARVDATNDANRECRALGIGWSYSGMQFAGYEQCFSCKSAGFKCAVTQAIHICTNPQKEREEKAAKARAEKEAADKAAKAKADEIAAKLRVEKAAKERAEKEAAAKAAKARAEQIAQKEREEKAARERAASEAAAKAARAEQIARKQREDAVAKERADKEAASKAANAAAEQAAKNKARAAEKNSIDDAFARMEKQTGKAPASNVTGIDAAFSKMEVDRVERARVAARREGYTRLCEEAISEQQACFVNVCNRMPRETISECTSQYHERGPSAMMRVAGARNRDTQPSFIKVDHGGGHIIFGPGFGSGSGCTRREKRNPKYAEWESCTRRAESQCMRGTSARSVEACVNEKERAALAK